MAATIMQEYRKMVVKLAIMGFKTIKGNSRTAESDKSFAKHNLLVFDHLINIFHNGRRMPEIF